MHIDKKILPPQKTVEINDLEYFVRVMRSRERVLLETLAHPTNPYQLVSVWAPRFIRVCLRWEGNPGVQYWSSRFPFDDVEGAFREVVGHVEQHGLVQGGLALDIDGSTYDYERGE